MIGARGLGEPLTSAERSHWLLVLLFGAVVAGISLGVVFFGAHP